MLSLTSMAITRRSSVHVIPCEKKKLQHIVLKNSPILIGYSKSWMAVSILSLICWLLPPSESSISSSSNIFLNMGGSSVNLKRL